MSRIVGTRPRNSPQESTNEVNQLRSELTAVKEEVVVLKKLVYEMDERLKVFESSKEVQNKEKLIDLLLPTLRTEVEKKHHPRFQKEVDKLKGNSSILNEDWKTLARGTKLRKALDVLWDDEHTTMIINDVLEMNKEHPLVISTRSDHKEMEQFKLEAVAVVKKKVIDSLDTMRKAHVRKLVNTDEMEKPVVKKRKRKSTDIVNKRGKRLATTVRTPVSSPRASTTTSATVISEVASTPINNDMPIIIQSPPKITILGETTPAPITSSTPSNTAPITNNDGDITDEEID